MLQTSDIKYDSTEVAEWYYLCRGYLPDITTWQNALKKNFGSSDAYDLVTVLNINTSILICHHFANTEHSTYQNVESKTHL